jgi:hypothetical protein
VVRPNILLEFIAVRLCCTTIIIYLLVLLPNSFCGSVRICIVIEKSFSPRYLLLVFIVTGVEASLSGPDRAALPPVITI